MGCAQQKEIVVQGLDLQVVVERSDRHDVGIAA